MSWEEKNARKEEIRAQNTREALERARKNGKYHDASMFIYLFCQTITTQTFTSASGSSEAHKVGYFRNPYSELY